MAATAAEPLPVVLVVAVALVDADGRILLAQRPAGKSMAGLWEFPGGKVEPGETPEAALARELEEELGIHAQIDGEITRYEYQYAGRPPILLIFYRVTTFAGEPRNLEFAQILWVAPEQLPDYDFLEGDAGFILRYSSLP